MGTFEEVLNAFFIMMWLQAYGGQGVQRGGLNEKAPIGSIICMLGTQLNCLEGLESVSLLE